MKYTLQMIYSSGIFEINFMVNDIILHKDSKNAASFYEAISVVEFNGTLQSSGESQGHYICDIMDKSSKSWYRTNNNSRPFQIRLQDVSKYGYVVLYKRKDVQQ